MLAELADVVRLRGPRGVWKKEESLSAWSSTRAHDAGAHVCIRGINK